MLETFDSFNTSIWKKSDGYSNGNPFNCTWRAANALILNTGKLALTLGPDQPGSNPAYAGAEIQSVANTFGYGYYEVRMSPSPKRGVISSFFVYTGPAFGTRWDEIDIELGTFGDHSKVRLQCNYYSNGVGGHEFVLDLPFDPAADSHTYAFNWQPGRIEWFVDGVSVHVATDNIPVTPGKLMANIWTPIGADDWAGVYEGTATGVIYDSFSYTSPMASGTSADLSQVIARISTIEKALKGIRAVLDECYPGTTPS
jgi:endo-1,3-1,4-beta-glycanase ExoK